MNGLILHCGGEETTLADVCAVTPPKATSSYKPVHYGDAIEYMQKTVARRLGMDVLSEAYGLNKAGDQMFARMTLDTGDAAQGLSIGMRQSYNKSLALGVAAGTNVFVCDNLCFSGDAFKVVRKNTTNVWPDFKALVQSQISTALESYTKTRDETDRMRQVACNEKRGYAFLGVAIGAGVLTTTQASVAFQDWAEPRHAEFSDRNVWSLYNCVTEGLKKGPPAKVFERHAVAHEFFNDVVVAN